MSAWGYKRIKKIKNATSSQQFNVPQRAKKGGRARAQGRGKILESTCYLRSEASESHVPIRAFASSPDEGVGLALPTPQQDTHPTPHLAHTDPRTSRLKAPRS